MTNSEAPKLYTNENVVLASKIVKADTSDPVFIQPDSAGNHALTSVVQNSK